MSARQSPRRESGATPLLCLRRFDSPLTHAWQAEQIAQLTPTECARLARIDRALRREQFVVGHCMLRWALAAAGFDDAKVEVGADGRVLLSANVPAYASIAHSANAVAVVIAGVPVGVDLEPMGRLRDPSAAAAMLGLAAEGDHDPCSALRAWVAAEARLKAGSRACAPVWRSNWECCQLAVAGTVNPPLTGAFDAMTGNYNASELKWESV